MVLVNISVALVIQMWYFSIASDVTTMLYTTTKYNYIFIRGISHYVAYKQNMILIDI